MATTPFPSKKMGRVDEERKQFTADHVKNKELVISMLRYEDGIIKGTAVHISPVEDEGRREKDNGEKEGEKEGDEKKGENGGDEKKGEKKRKDNAGEKDNTWGKGKEIYRDSLLDSHSLEPEYKIHRLVLEKFGFHTTAEDVGNAPHNFSPLLSVTHGL